MTKRVLVIDDDDPVREAIHDILETREIEVIGADNGPDGIDLFAQHHASIAAVMIDMRLPGMGGEEIVDRIRAIDPQAKIILSSAYLQTEINQMVGDMSAYEFLPKPFDFHTLLKVVGAFVNVPAG
ncbi:MAG: response regulator [Anaerolineales bacterium]|nr:response regulator [Anaerolineales bacterium]MCB0012053.1 response regulator [Anaerolineales bacterium]MCB0028691.1 response regulator [Anaerolineales bacterium]